MSSLLDKNEPFHLRDPLPGDLGWIIQQHGQFYAQLFGWDQTFEGLVAGIVAEFTKNFDPEFERCWIAEREGGAIGSVCLVRESDDTARLRLLYVHESARGLGIGQRLVTETIKFARDTGYKKIVLWTNRVLLSARHIYESAGFVLIHEENKQSFGQDHVAQTWQCDL